MLLLAVSFAVGTMLPAPSAPANCESAAPADSTLLALYASGEDFATFLANADARKAQWQRNWEGGQVPPDILARAQSLPGTWKLLIVAVDGCSDSVNTVPYIARLVELVPSLELRIVKPDAGRAVQEAHRTTDGRAATPTVVLLDEQGNDVGCWVERPHELQDAGIKARAEGKGDEWFRAKQGWYDDDAGASTLREVVDIIAAAAAGTPICGKSPPARTP